MKRLLIFFFLLLCSTVVSALDTDIFLCLNDQPEISFTCPMAMNQSTRILDNSFTCNVTVLDEENGSLTATLDSVNTTTLNISLDNTTLFIDTSQESVGPHLITFSTEDESECVNSFSDEDYSLYVRDINDPPENILDIPDTTFGQGVTVFPFALNDFFTDPDGDSMNYSVVGQNLVSASIFASSDVLLTSQQCGNEYLIFRATDPYNLSDETDPVLIKIICAANQDTGSESGSSRGGSSGSNYECRKKWQCTEWSECLINGTRSKTCIDLNGCEPNDYIQKFTEECEYIPTCSDGVLNGDEEDIDCGGSSCKACGTCIDGIQNQDEEGIDCGGSFCEPCYDCTNGIQDWDEEGIDCGGPICRACPTCFDGIQNQDEEGIDCGGSCAACAGVEQPTLIEEAKAPLTALFILLAVIAIAIGVGLRLFRKQLLGWLSFLGWYMVGKRPKEILLSQEQKNTLLAKVYAQPELDEVLIIAREYLAATIKQHFTFTQEDLLKGVKKYAKHGSLRHVLISFYEMIHVFEQGVDRMSHQQYRSLIQEIEMLIYSTSKITGQEPHKDSTTLEVKGRYAFFDALYNTYLALRFEEMHEAKKNFRIVLACEEALTPKQRGEVQSLLMRLYHEIRYELSWEGMKQK